jgi:flagellar motor switch protein FliG
VRDAVLGAVSKRLRGILEAEAEAVGEKTQAEVEAARKSVESVMRRLQAQGTLQTTPSA